MNCGAQSRDRHTVDHNFFVWCCLGYVPQARRHYTWLSHDTEIETLLVMVGQGQCCASPKPPALARLFDLPNLIWIMVQWFCSPLQLA
jgi:hypothetical protein